MIDAAAASADDESEADEAADASDEDPRGRGSGSIGRRRTRGIEEESAGTARALAEFGLPPQLEQAILRSRLRVLHADPGRDPAALAVRLRRHRPGADGYGQDRRLPHLDHFAPAREPAGGRAGERSPACADHRTDPRARPADRRRRRADATPAVDERRQRGRRHGLRTPAQDPGVGDRRHPRRHAGPPHRLRDSRQGESAQGRAGRPRRGRPHAFNGLHPGRARIIRQTPPKPRPSARPCSSARPSTRKCSTSPSSGPTNPSTW